MRHFFFTNDTQNEKFIRKVTSFKTNTVANDPLKKKKKKIQKRNTVAASLYLVAFLIANLAVYRTEKYLIYA